MHLQLEFAGGLKINDSDSIDQKESKTKSTINRAGNLKPHLLGQMQIDFSGFQIAVPHEFLYLR